MQTMIKCGRLYDGITDDLQENIDILIEGKRIKAVGKDLKHEADARIIDLSHLTVTPGLIDAHVHPNVADWKTFWTTLRSDAHYTLASLHTAERELEHGFTTIRCHATNSSDYGIIDVRDMINAGYFKGARLKVACHMIGTEGCHIDPGQSFKANPALGLNNYGGCPHPRNCGSFPRFLRLVRENSLMPIEDAVFKMTGLPSTIMHTDDQFGFLKEGLDATVTVFDKDTVTDHATYEEPNLKNEGIDYVFVNGALVFDHGTVTEARPGKCILR